jgi:hypothetical protein
LWAQEIDGDPKMRDASNEWGPIPTVESLEMLASELITLTVELNDARLKGWLFEALSTRRPAE